MARRSRHWLLPLSLILLSSQAAAECFLPNGTARNFQPGVDEGDYLPCNNNARVSMCCALGRAKDPDTCLSNGLCKSKDDNVYWRESCTDRKWGPGCVQLFVTGVGADNDIPLSLCDDGSWCAGANIEGRKCCQAGRGMFILDDGSVSTSQATTTSTQSSTTSQTATSTASRAAKSGKPDSSPSPAGKVGIGVGLGLGSIALALGIGFFFWHRRRQARKPVVMPEMLEQDPSEGDYHYQARTDFQRQSTYSPSMAAPTEYTGYSAELDSQSMLAPPRTHSRYGYSHSRSASEFEPVELATDTRQPR